MDKIKVLVADSQRLFSGALALALSSNGDFHVLDERPTSGQEALRVTAGHKPDVVLVDQWLGGQRAPLAVAGISNRYPVCRIVVMGWFYGVQEVRDALRAGAAGFLPKSVSIDQVADATRRTASGEAPVSAGDAEQLVSNIHLERIVDGDEAGNQLRTWWSSWGTLAPREVQVLQLLSATGKLEAAAAAMSITPRTARSYLYSILRKTGEPSPAAAVTRGRKWGVISSQGTVGASPSAQRRSRPRAAKRVATSTTKVTVVIADAQALFSEALAAALAAESDIAMEKGRPTGAQEVLDAVVCHAPDVVLLDHWLPGMDASSLTSTIIERSPESKVLLLSWVHSRDQIEEALRAGAMGFVPKSVGVHDVADAVRRAHQGEPLVYGPELSDLIDSLRERRETARSIFERFKSLSPRELDVLLLLAQGNQVAEVCRFLGIGTRTGNAHVGRILAKTGARSHLEAVTMAERCGFFGVEMRARAHPGAIYIQHSS